VGLETRIELLGKFFAEQEGRPEWTPDEPQAVERKRSDDALAAIGAEVVESSGSRVLVRCPHCRGVRTVTRRALQYWRKAGRVTECSAVNPCVPDGQRRAV
jgi:hypothetical protein